MNKPLLDTKKASIDLSLNGDTAVFAPKGILDEDFSFKILADAISKFPPTVKKVQFDLSAVTRLNSCGIRDWLIFLDKWPKNLALHFVNIGQVFVEQANLISNVLGPSGTPIHSFFAPYYCSTCDKESLRLLEPKQVKKSDGSFAPPAVKCEKCGSNLDFDWIEEEYFRFLR